MTRSLVALAAVSVLSAIVAMPVKGQTPRSSSQQPPATRSDTSTTTAVLVDVVVRDKKGRPVTDLSAVDFDVAEDRVVQKVDSFTRVSHGGGIGVGVAWRSPSRTTAVTPTAAPPSPADADPLPDDATTALVFDHLSTESLRLAQKATLDYVPLNGESSIRVGVFATDPGVRVVQAYTTERALVRRAVARLVPSGTTAEEEKTERNDELMGRRRQLQGETQSAAAGVVAGTGAALARNASELGGRETELALIQTELNMIRSFDNLDRDHRGYDTALALLSVVQSLSVLPGRKTIVFFSEGLPVSPALSARLDYVIDVANRANVTAYAVDANGLRTRSALTNTRKEIDAFGEERMAQTATGTNKTEQPLTMAFERVEDTLKLDSRSGLAKLAEDTGGFLVEQSNDLTSAFRRIDEDNQFHYLLTYSPKNTTFDGRFRAIQVKVHRPGTQVFARKGYRALRAAPGLDGGSYETPALALLDRTPLPNAFPIQAAGFSFPAPARPGLTPLLVRVGTDALRFSVDQQRSTYSAQAAVVVRIRDSEGHQVQTVGQQYVLSGEAKDLDAAKRGEILFYREADLPPGVYTMETIVMDVVARQGSARAATLNVSAPQPATFDMSSLVLVSRAEEVTAGQAVPDAPLYVGRTLLYPNLGAPIKKSAAGALPFYFTLYGDLNNVKVYAQLLRNGEAVAEAPVALSPATGPRLQHVGRLPIASLAAGTYELRIRATDGTHEISRTAFFTLQE
jgi:VWFA-related protein